MRRTAAVIFLGVLLFALTCVFFKAHFSQVNGDDAQQKAYVFLVHTFGAHVAYTMFSRDQEGISPNIQHARAHVFGAALYQVLGKNGITTCTNTFGFGCVHGFLIAHINDVGVQAIPDAGGVCMTRFGDRGTGCLHGVGHGILEYLGGDDVARALSLCKETVQVYPLLGCASGVFMEYRTPGAVSGRYVRAFNEHDPYDSCQDVESAYVQSCYFELGMWWNQVLGGDVSRMYSLCMAVPNLAQRHVCVQGVGYTLAHRLYPDIQSARSVCSMYAQERPYCLAGVAWRYLSESNDEDVIDVSCESRFELEHKLCVEHADLAR